MTVFIHCFVIIYNLKLCSLILNTSKTNSYFQLWVLKWTVGLFKTFDRLMGSGKHGSVCLVSHSPIIREPRVPGLTKETSQPTADMKPVDGVNVNPIGIV